MAFQMSVPMTFVSSIQYQEKTQRFLYVEYVLKKLNLPLSILHTINNKYSKIIIKFFK